MSFNEDNHYLPTKPTYLTNPLLRKSIVGRTRGAPDPVPGGDEAIFGRPNNQNEEGAAEVVHCWKTHTPNPEAIAHRDFVKTNKMATSEGCTTAKSNTRYRHSHMYRQRKSSGTAKSNADKVFHDKIQRETFGMKNRPSTPIKSLIMSQFHRNWVESQKTILQKKPNTRKLGSSDLPLSLERTYAKKDFRAEQPFKMKQFESVKSRVAVPDKMWYKNVKAKQAEKDKEDLYASNVDLETAIPPPEAGEPGQAQQEQESS